ncbi:LytTR family transcriptional regulator [Sphingomonas panacisoli]|uniref:LytTR family transcriptional regulator n=1 Tax=Sphingomonas panacisoli TaxID=1813879 RepID=A0A5B8LKN9_9SPHN|nr:LytTR family DNA-binding domain-containing protein [Sphingomonas panacisoli]QDZ08489.1 LytTR family transcriptional regulator [Sphingomonas panacisoli]
MPAATRFSIANRRTTGCVGERSRARPRTGWWVVLLCWLTWLAATPAVAADAAPAMRQGPIQVCAADGSHCRETALWNIRPVSDELILSQQIIVDSGALPPLRPPTLWIAATASSEVRWNGVPIGSNGTPAMDRAGEVPGNYVASVAIPPALIRPGVNSLSIRMSFHHLWLPVHSPVRLVYLDPSGAGDNPQLRAYLPSLLMFGTLAAAFAYFGFAAATDRTNGAARILASVAALACIQLATETARLFVAYPYPWQLARVVAIAVLAATISVLFVAYAARRFWPARRRLMVSMAAIAALASAVLVPVFDGRALGAITAGAVAVMICAAVGAARERSGSALVALAIAGTTLVLVVTQWGELLDTSWYLLVAGTLIVLLVEQLLDFNRVRRHAARLSARLHSLESQDRPILLKDGARTHCVDPGQILSISAADDYCEVHLADGRTLLVSSTFSGLLASLPPGFPRIHRSHAVNRVHIASVARGASGRMVQLSTGKTLPVGRSFAAAVDACVGRNPQPSDMRL